MKTAPTLTMRVFFLIRWILRFVQNDRAFFFLALRVFVMTSEFGKPPTIIRTFSLSLPRRRESTLAALLHQHHLLCLYKTSRLQSIKICPA